MPKHFDLRTAPGVAVEQRVEPLARVGCYVPGGRFPLPSSLLMTAVPARVAGVREIVVVCPRPEPAVMAAALEAGVTRLFRIGGAHAIAALAYGTDDDAARGQDRRPGNRYVAAAKAIVAADCAIDFYAGPTEIVIVAGAGRPAWIAADLVAQAEHDPDARAIFITWSRPLADARRGRGRPHAPRGAIVARRRLPTHGAIVVARTADEAMALANRLAPEHLVVDRESLHRRPLTAGAVFVGPFTRAGRRRLRDRLEPRAADGRRRAIPRRAERRRFRARDVGAAHHARRPRAARADDPSARAGRRARRARRIDRRSD